MKTRIKTPVCFIIGCLLGSILLSCSQPPPPPLPSLNKTATILAFGDSLTYGSGAPSAQSYPQQLQKIIKRKVIAAGIPGETSAQALRRLPALLRSYHPALLILCTGGNDFLRHLPEEETEENIRRMLQIADKAGIATILIAVPKVALWEANQPLYARVAGDKYWLEDEILKTVLHDPKLKSDRFHPNAAGYGHIAEAVAALLRRGGAI